MELILKRFDRPDEVRKTGDIFYIAPGHDSWVVGDEPYVSLHLMGAGDYAAQKTAQSKQGRAGSSS